MKLLEDVLVAFARAHGELLATLLLERNVERLRAVAVDTDDSEVIEDLLRVARRAEERRLKMVERMESLNAEAIAEEAKW